MPLFRVAVLACAVPLTLLLCRLVNGCFAVKAFGWLARRCLRHRRAAPAAAGAAARRRLRQGGLALAREFLTPPLPLTLLQGPQPGTVFAVMAFCGVPPRSIVVCAMLPPLR